MGSENTFSVVVPTHGRHSRLNVLLESLSHALLPATLAEIVVVENGERHGAEEVCRQWGERLPVPVRYIHEREANLGNARNAGARVATGSRIVFFDDDVRVEAHCLQSYAAAFECQHGLAFFGGPVLPEYEEAPPAWLKQFYPPSAAGFHLGDEPKQVHDTMFIGPNLAVDKGVAAAGIEFDRFAATGNNAGILAEEKRWQRRMLDRDIPGLYVPGAVVYHYVPRSRCSIAWLRERYYRTGLTDAFCRAAADEPTLAGVSRWIWRVRLIALARLAGTNLLTRNREIRLRAALKSDYARGLVAGVRMKRAEDVTEPFA